jgi:hypothetical protein
MKNWLCIKGCPYYGNTLYKDKMDMNIGNTFSLKDAYIRDKYKTAKMLQI